MYDRVAEAGAGVMASKAGRLKQKALSVVDTVQTLSSHNSSNSCTITVKVSGRWSCDAPYSAVVLYVLSFLTYVYESCRISSIHSSICCGVCQ